MHHIVKEETGATALPDRAEDPRQKEPILRTPRFTA
jgi:hypothetical protein